MTTKVPACFVCTKGFQLVRRSFTEVRRAFLAGSYQVDINNEKVVAPIWCDRAADVAHGVAVNS